MFQMAAEKIWKMHPRQEQKISPKASSTSSGQQPKGSPPSAAKEMPRRVSGKQRVALYQPDSNPEGRTGMTEPYYAPESGEALEDAKAQPAAPEHEAVVVESKKTHMDGNSLVGLVLKRKAVQDMLLDD